MLHVDTRQNKSEGIREAMYEGIRARTLHVEARQSLRREERESDYFEAEAAAQGNRI